MAEIRVDDATLHAAANDTRTAATEVRGEASKVRSAKETVAARWQGNASTTFQNVIDAWLADAGKLLEALDAIGDLLDKTANIQRANEEEQDSMFAKFNQALNR